MQNILDPVFNQGIDSYDVMYKITTYSLRRTSGTKIYRAHGIITAKKFLNHTDIKTTMKYLNVSDEEVGEAVNVL
jgi:integrase